MTTVSMWPQGYGRRVLAQVDSTNAHAQQIAETVSGPEWILALDQTASRARRGRGWSFPQGNFAATLLLHPKEPPATVALRSFVAALALRETFVAATGREENFALKWPNDVLLNGGKVAGILLESVGAKSGVAHLAIGFGVNLVAAPSISQVEENAMRPVALLGETGINIPPESFLDLLAVSYARFENQFVTFGFAPIREAWLRHATRLGKVITARTGRNETIGTFETIDEVGNLVLSTAKGRATISAADVYF